MLDRAIKVFWDKGYDGASLDELTRAMGIGRPSLYSAFGDKRTLFLRALERYGQTVGRCGLVALGEDDIHEAVPAMLARTLAAQLGKGGPAGWLVGSSVGAALGTVEGVDAVLGDMDEGMQTAITHRFAAAIEAGDLPPDFPSRERARLLIDLVHAQARRARAGEPAEALSAEIASKAEAVLR